jgi:ketosteroid isomerase-like protein
MSDTDRSAFAHASARLLNAVNSADVDAVLAVGAEDGVMMPPDKLPVSWRSTSGTAVPPGWRRM